MKKNIIIFMLVALILMLLQSVANPFFVWHELRYHLEVLDLRGVTKGSIYLITYLLAIVPLFMLLKLKSNRLFLFLLTFVFLFMSIDFFVQFLGIFHGFSYDEYTLTMNEAGNYKYLIAYATSIVQAVALALVVVTIYYFIRKKLMDKSLKNRYLLLALVPFMVVYFACYKMDTFRLSSYPSMVKIPDIAMSYWQFSKPIKARILPKNITPKVAGKFKNIVWIIDESITGSYLSLNGYGEKTTPFLDEFSQKSQDFVNFGKVNSISNCSGTSNLFLRIGVNPYTYSKNQISQLPTIFQYAKRAGYTTWLFDSQTRENHLQNYLTIYDKESIDNFKTLGTEIERTQRDETFLNEMIGLVNNQSSSQKNFIVLVKYGAHFPYLLTYDHKNRRFTPTLKTSYGGMDEAHREEQINTYLNSIYFNVDLYFKKMLAKIDLTQSIVFYTSDHGQNILETKGLTRTHCNSETIVKNEVTVPLFLLTHNAKEQFPKKENGFYSHIQIFPTTLGLFGYEHQIVQAYGKSLNEAYAKSSNRKYIPVSSKKAKVYQ